MPPPPSLEGVRPCGPSNLASALEHSLLLTDSMSEYTLCVTVSQGWIPGGKRAGCLTLLSRHIWWKSLSEPRSPRDKALRARKVRDTLGGANWDMLCRNTTHLLSLGLDQRGRQIPRKEPRVSGSAHSQLPCQRRSPDPQQPSPESGQPRRVGSSRGSHKLKTSEGTPGGEHCLSLPAPRVILLCL